MEPRYENFPLKIVTYLQLNGIFELVLQIQGMVCLRCQDDTHTLKRTSFSTQWCSGFAHAPLINTPPHIGLVSGSVIREWRGCCCVCMTCMKCSDASERFSDQRFDIIDLSASTQACVPHPYLCGCFPSAFCRQRSYFFVNDCSPLVACLQLAARVCRRVIHDRLIGFGSIRSIHQLVSHWSHSRSVSQLAVSFDSWQFLHAGSWFLRSAQLVSLQQSSVASSSRISRQLVQAPTFVRFARVAFHTLFNIRRRSVEAVSQSGSNSSSSLLLSFIFSAFPSSVVVRRVFFLSPSLKGQSCFLLSFNKISKISSLASVVAVVVDYCFIDRCSAIERKQLLCRIFFILL